MQCSYKGRGCNDYTYYLFEDKHYPIPCYFERRGSPDVIAAKNSSIAAWIFFACMVLCFIVAVVVTICCFFCGSKWNLPSLKEEKAQKEREKRGEFTAMESKT